VTRPILIVGCGELGTRHLQAVAAVPGVAQIDVVDPNPEALVLGQTRLAERSVPAGLEVRWMTSLREATPGGALAIVATQADVRCALARDVIEDLGYRTLILEKMVAQSTADYEQLLDVAGSRGAALWVNCKTRAHASHRYVKAQLEPAVPLSLTATGGNHGLANNGIHAADLFVFYDGATELESRGGHVDPVLHRSKRGPAVFDLSGTLIATTKRGSRFVLSYAPDHAAPGCFVVETVRYRAIVDDVAKLVTESRADDGWRWRSVPFAENLAVSHMTTAFVVDILATGRCALPTLAEAYPAHRFILDELRPHFARLLGRDVVRCPVA
jgi:predicted dehydrogenase